MDKIRQFILISLSASLFGMSGILAQEARDQMLRDLAIPLMQGFSENIDEAILFDSPEGRIISAQASGPVALDATFDYYKMVLPSLGWQSRDESGCEPEADRCYQALREGEILSLSFKYSNGVTLIDYALSPN